MKKLNILASMPLPPSSYFKILDSSEVSKDQYASVRRNWEAYGVMKIEPLVEDKLIVVDEK